MELIKPFVKYSKMYRHTTDKRVRRFIYNSWCAEAQQAATAAMTTSQPISNLCAFCYTVNDTATFCTHCLFPLACDEEFGTYCLLSVCYHESSNNCVAASRSHRTVYRQRLKMTWYEYERSGKTYHIAHSECFQCKRSTKSSFGAQYTYFNDNMFCSNCMFPLFTIKNHLS
jgi:Protein of unknown function (DUF2616)